MCSHFAVIINGNYIGIGRLVCYLPESGVDRLEAECYVSCGVVSQRYLLFDNGQLCRIYLFLVRSIGRIFLCRLLDYLAVLVELHFLAVNADSPAHRTLAAGAVIIGLAVALLPACEHNALIVKEVIAAAYLVNACNSSAVLAEIIFAGLGFGR